MTAAEFDIVLIGIELSLVFLVEKFNDIFIFITGIMNTAILLFVEDEHINTQLAELGKLDGLFQKTNFTFAERDTPVTPALNRVYLLQSTFTHLEVTKLVIF